MQTIQITITSGKVASVVIREQKEVSEEAKRKAALAYLDAMFKPVIKNVGE